MSDKELTKIEIITITVQDDTYCSVYCCYHETVQRKPYCNRYGESLLPRAGYDVDSPIRCDRCHHEFKLEG